VWRPPRIILSRTIVGGLRKRERSANQDFLPFLIVRSYSYYYCYWRYRARSRAFRYYYYFSRANVIVCPGKWIENQRRSSAGRARDDWTSLDFIRIMDTGFVHVPDCLLDTPSARSYPISNKYVFLVVVTDIRSCMCVCLCKLIKISTNRAIVSKLIITVGPSGVRCSANYGQNNYPTSRTAF